MRSPPLVPPLRDDLKVRKLGKKIVVEDAARHVRVPIDELALALIELLAEGPAAPDELVEAVQAPRIELQRRVAILNRQNLLQTPRAADQLRVHLEAQVAPADVEPVLRFHPGLAHGCVACGGCCHGTDVGPLKEDDVARIREVDWRPLLPGVTPDEWVSEIPAERSPSQQPIQLMGMREGRCIFLGEDKLCIIHKHKGSQHKPTICRQFPYTFTRTPTGIDVSFSTECRAWWKARNNALPPAQDEAQQRQIRALLAEGAPVVALPVPIPLAAGVDIDLMTWESLRAQLIAGIEAAAAQAELVAAVVLPVRRALDAVTEGYRDTELFATRDAWALPEADPGDQTARFFETVARLRQDLSEGIDAIADGMREAGKREDADRASRLGWGLGETLSGRQIGDLVPFQHGLEVWRDLALASVQAHEPARRGDLLLGLATLVMKLTTGPMLAGLSAQAALRGRIHEQEVVDAMVLVTKLPRGSAFERLFKALRRDFVTVFFCDALTLVARAAPRPLPGWL